MTELDQAVLKLRVRFHKRLAGRLGLTIDEERINERADRLNDRELFKYIETYRPPVRVPKPPSSSRLVRFIRSTFIGRLKIFTTNRIKLPFDSGRFTILKDHNNIK